MNMKLITAITTVLAAAGLASAQYQVDRSGATDANNRIGSGGRNITKEQPKPWQLSNDTVYGNVTGGKQFRGNLSTSDASEFRGTTGNVTSDNFVRDSAGISTGGRTSYNSNTTQRFYGGSRAAPPPAGFAMIPGSGGYVPPRNAPYRTVDPRLGAMSSDVDVSFRPDQFGLPGPIDSGYSPNAIIVPSIVQARQLDAGQLSEYTQLNQRNQNQLSAQQLRELQRELGEPAGRQDESKGAQPSGGLNDRVQPGQVNANDQVQDAVESTSLNAAIDSTKTPEMGTRFTLVGAEQQSGVYATLAKQRGEKEKLRPGEANAQAARDFNESVRKRAEAEANPDTAKPDDQPKPTPGGDAAAKPQPGAGENVPNIGGAAAKPPKFESLADTSKTGLNELLKKAEAQLREGKFNSAIETYESAERVAPNNPLIKLGRGHAELGGGYYRRAEVSLRQTLSADKNLLAGQYDLRSFIGAERLKTVEQDLRDLIQKNPNDVGSAVLLAYVYYNTANERRAASLLDLAEKRSGGKDGFITVLKQNWALPAAEPLELNK